MIAASAFQLLLTLLNKWLDRKLTDEDRRRLAVRAYRLGRGRLRQIATVVTPDTLLRWHRQLIARK